MIVKLLFLYLAQLTKVALPLIFIPLLINIVGIKEYAIVSFLMLLLSLLGLIDAGISGSMVRLISTTKDNVHSHKDTLNLWTKFFSLILFLGFLIAIFFVTYADLISMSWIKSDLDRVFLSNCVAIVGVITALNFVKGFLVSKIVAYEKHEHLSVWQAISVILQYTISYLALLHFSKSIYVYLCFIAFFTFIECLFLFAIGAYFSNKQSSLLNQKFQKCITSNKKVNVVSVKSFLIGSISLSSLTIIWTLTSQADKIILSGAVDIKTFSYYQIAAQVSLCINLLIMPLNQYLMPRLSNMYASADKDSLPKVWFSFFFYFTAFVGLFSPLYIFFGEHVINLWLGDKIVSENVHLFLKWLFFSAIVQAVSNFIFIYYYAIDKLNKQLIAYVTYCVLVIPCIYFSLKFFGAEFCAIFTMCSSIIFLVVWGALSIKWYIEYFRFDLVFFIIVIFLLSTSFIYFFGEFFYFLEPLVQLFLISVMYGLSVLYFIKVKVKVNYLLRLEI